MQPWVKRPLWPILPFTTGPKSTPSCRSQPAAITPVCEREAQPFREFCVPLKYRQPPELDRSQRMKMTLTVEGLVRMAMANPINAEITSRLPALGLDQCMLTAGCLFQAIWNNRSQLPPAWGVKDYDVFYFDMICPGRPRMRLSIQLGVCFRTSKLMSRSRIRLASTFGTASDLAGLSSA